MIVIMGEEIETIKRIKKIWYFNQIKDKINNLKWDVLKREGKIEK